MIKRLYRELPFEFRQFVQDTKYVATSFSVNIGSVATFLLFVGNSRSGTTLVRSLLDAHPNAFIGNEVHVLQYLQDGKSWRNVIGRILENSRSFAKNPLWTGYLYRLDSSFTLRQGKNPRLIGDKKAEHTAALFQQFPDMLHKLLSWSPVPVRIVQCIRHPTDTIATLARRHSLSMVDASEQYFARHHSALTVMETVGKDSFYQIYLEDLISAPEQQLLDLFDFCGLSINRSYIDACRKLIFDKPHETRNNVDWPPFLLFQIHQRMRDDPYLCRYSKIANTSG